MAKLEKPQYAPCYLYGLCRVYLSDVFYVPLTYKYNFPEDFLRSVQNFSGDFFSMTLEGNMTLNWFNDLLTITSKDNTLFYSSCCTYEEFTTMLRELLEDMKKYLDDWVWWSEKTNAENFEETKQKLMIDIRNAEIHCGSYYQKSLELSKPKYGWCKLLVDNTLELDFSYLKNFPLDLVESIEEFEKNHYKSFYIEFDLEDKGQVSMEWQDDTLSIWEVDERDKAMFEKNMALDEFIHNLIYLLNAILDDANAWTLWDLQCASGNFTTIRLEILLKVTKVLERLRITKKVDEIH